MTEKELWGYFGKKVKVKCATGETIKGIVKGFTRAIDEVEAEYCALKKRKD